MIEINNNSDIQKDLVEYGVATFHYTDTGLRDMVDFIQLFDSESLSNFMETTGVNIAGDHLRDYLKYYFNDDNHSETIYSFKAPSSKLISSGTLLFAFNHTDEPLLVAKFNGSDITLSPDHGVILNLGLSGVPFELKESGVLQGVIHSKLDGINYFQDGEPLSQEELAPHDVPRKFYLNQIDLNSWVKDGCALNSLNPDCAKQLLEDIKNEHFQAVTQNDMDQYCGYGERYISKHSMYKPRSIKPCFQEILDETSLLAAPILANKPNPNGHNLTAFCGIKGHFMDTHSDCADASPIITIIYLSDEQFGAEDGGSVVAHKMAFNADVRKVRSVEEVAKCSPNQGAVIHINNTNVKFAHQVHGVLSERYRYSIVINHSMLTNPSWDIDFDEKPRYFDKNPEKLELPN